MLRAIDGGYLVQHEDSELDEQLKNSDRGRPSSQ